MFKQFFQRRLTALSVLLACLSASFAPAQGTGTVFTNLQPQQAGNIPDNLALATIEALLGELDAMPSSGEPTVLQIQSIDSRYALPANASAAARLKAQTDLIVQVLEEHGGPESIFVATQWGTHENRTADGQMMGRDAPFFPTTAVELEASDLAWLTDPSGFTVRWDSEGALADVAATRTNVRGMEFRGPVRMLLCADDKQILGWARTQRQSMPTTAALARFVADCVNGEYTGLSADYQLPTELLTAHNLQDTWFAVLLLDAFSQPVPVSDVTAAAQTVLQAANTPIPLITVAGETVTADYEDSVTASEHRAALVELGVQVDSALSDSIPKWVYSFSTHPATTLVIFDETGRAAAFFAAAPSNPTSVQTLQQWMMLNGLF